MELQKFTSVNLRPENDFGCLTSIDCKTVNFFVGELSAARKVSIASVFFFALRILTFYLYLDLFLGFFNFTIKIHDEPSFEKNDIIIIIKLMLSKLLPLPLP